MAGNAEQVVIGKVRQNLEGYTPVYIGRGSPLGNPWPISQYRTRDMVCDRHAVYFEEQVKLKGSPINKEMQRLVRLILKGEKLLLQCFCVPKRCHGETVK